MLANMMRFPVSKKKDAIVSELDALFSFKEKRC